MTLRFLEQARDAGKPFPGVRYNTDKVAIEKGELMLARNFGALEGLANPRPQDYINYLEAWSRQSARIKYPQLHVVLSAKGREMDKYQLTELAEKWLPQMGYSESPYLLVFHKDTKNNHLHIVASRVGADRKKVDDSYEIKRGHRVLNGILGIVPKKDAQAAIAGALAFQLSTRAQFMLLLELKGYSLKAGETEMAVYKYGKQVGGVPLAELDAKLAGYQADRARIHQLRAIIAKYRHTLNPALYPVREPLPGGGQGRITGYASELTAHLHERLALQFIFHHKDGKPAYGYTVIDHTHKAVYKGSQLLPLAELLAPPGPESPRNEMDMAFDQIIADGTQPFAGDDLIESGSGRTVEMPSAAETYVPPLRIDIAGDIDDEQILGRNRRRKRKARTNTR